MDPDPAIFVIDLQDANKKLLKVHLHHFSKIKSPKEVTKQSESRFFLLFLLDRRIRIRSQSRIRIHTSDSWIRIREAQNMWILWIRIRIRIRNTGCGMWRFLSWKRGKEVIKIPRYFVVLIVLNLCRDKEKESKNNQNPANL
jgi:hypothetical protein